MTSETARALNESYRLALQQTIQKVLKTQPEWDRFTGIARMAAERIDAENIAYRDDYQTRLTKAREVVLREQSGLDVIHPTPTGMSVSRKPPTPEQIERLAEARVRHDHDQRLAAIRKDEVNQYKSLRDDLRDRDQRQSQARELRQNHARDAFRITQMSPSRQ